jgi:hypothetical protein
MISVFFTDGLLRILVVGQNLRVKWCDLSHFGDLTLQSAKCQHQQADGLAPSEGVVHECTMCFYSVL